MALALLDALDRDLRRGCPVLAESDGYRVLAPRG